MMGAVNSAAGTPTAVATAVAGMYNHDIAMGATLVCLAFSLTANVYLLKSILSIKDMLTSLLVAISELNVRLEHHDVEEHENVKANPVNPTAQ